MTSRQQSAHSAMPLATMWSGHADGQGRQRQHGLLGRSCRQSRRARHSNSTGTAKTAQARIWPTAFTRLAWLPSTRAGGCSCRPGCRCHGHRRGQSERRRLPWYGWRPASGSCHVRQVTTPKVVENKPDDGENNGGESEKPNEPETGSDGDKVEGSNVESLATARKAMIRGDSSGSGRQQRIGRQRLGRKQRIRATAAKPRSAIRQAALSIIT